MNYQNANVIKRKKDSKFIGKWYKTLTPTPPQPADEGGLYSL